MGLWKGGRVPERLCCPVDAYMLLERASMLLMLRRAPNAASIASRHAAARLPGGADSTNRA
jgi:hypothetical protein